VEPPRLIKDDAGNILETEIDGEGVQHKCHDQSTLWEGVSVSERHSLVVDEWKVGDTVESILARKKDTS
jgi:hypothetical protein